jgi:DtxR family Mn-dependent transcriptional regulator
VAANLQQSATESSDDYLKAILELSGVARQQVSASDLAAALRISRASVTKMLQRLSATKPPLLIYESVMGFDWRRLESTASLRSFATTG